MRIAILLQSCDETMGGIGIYTQEIVRALLRVDLRRDRSGGCTLSHRGIQQT